MTFRSRNLQLPEINALNSRMSLRPDTAMTLLVGALRADKLDVRDLREAQNEFWLGDNAPYFDAFKRFVVFLMKFDQLVLQYLNASHD